MRPARGGLGSLEPIALDPIADRPAYYCIVNQIGIATVHEYII